MVSGVKHQTEAHWDMAAERSLPLLACVNKVDKDFDKKLIHTVRGVGYVLKG